MSRDDAQQNCFDLFGGSPARATGANLKEHLFAEIMRLHENIFADRKRFQIVFGAKRFRVLTCKPSPSKIFSHVSVRLLLDLTATSILSCLPS